MVRPVRRHASILALVSLLLASLPACAGSRAYLDWRPGLSEIDFDGLFEIPLDEFDQLSAEAGANTIVVGESGRAKLGEALATTTTTDSRGYGVLELASDGRVTLQGDRGRDYVGAIDWAAVSPDRRHVALLSGTKLAVVIDGASTGIDVGALIGASASTSGYAMSMVVRDTELTVFALPQLGGVIRANQPGYLFEFRHLPGAREPWQVSVARVAVKL
jgi:hypothetical protein